MLSARVCNRVNRVTAVYVDLPQRLYYTSSVAGSLHGHISQMRCLARLGGRRSYGGLVVVLVISLIVRALRLADCPLALQGRALPATNSVVWGLPCPVSGQGV